MQELRLLVAGFLLRRTAFDPSFGGICGGRGDTGAGFLLILRFSLPIIIAATAPHLSSSVCPDWYTGQILANELHPKKLKKNLKFLRNT
jgi:hypothetical protein